MFEKIVKYFIPLRLVNSEVYSDIKTNKLFISFLLVIVLMLFIFSIMNYSSAKMIAGHIDLAMMFYFIVLLLYNKKSSLNGKAVFTFILGLLIILFTQHILAPLSLYSNLYWAPMFPIYICYLLNFKRSSDFLTFFALAVIITSEFISSKEIFVGDTFTADEALQYNLSALILSAFVARFLAKIIQSEEEFLSSKIQQRYAEISKLNITHASLVAMISHDIANPITAIHLNNQMLSHNHEGDNELKKYFSEISKETASISKMLKQVTTLKAAETGKLSITPKPTNLTQAIKESITNNERFASKKNINILFNCRKTIYILAEYSSLVNSVLNHLLANAIKFSYTSTDIQVSILEDNQDYTSLSIRDYGVGIPKDIIPFVFKHDVSTSREGTAGETGTGFGLPLVKLFLDRYNAQIDISSEGIDRAGTTVIIKFSKADTQETV